jgi:hypothetical protein
VEDVVGQAANQVAGSNASPNKAQEELMLPSFLTEGGSHNNAASAAGVSSANNNLLQGGTSAAASSLNQHPSMQLNPSSNMGSLMLPSTADNSILTTQPMLVQQQQQQSSQQQQQQAAAQNVIQAQIQVQEKQQQVIREQEMQIEALKAQLKQQQQQTLTAVAATVNPQSGPSPPSIIHPTPTPSSTAAEQALNRPNANSPLSEGAGSAPTAATASSITGGQYSGNNNTTAGGVGSYGNYIVGRIPANKHDNRKLFVGGLPNEGWCLCLHCC